MKHPPIKATKRQMTTELTKVARDAIVRKVIGEAICVTGQKSKDRLEICKQCPSFRTDKRCAECGCFMLIKAKLKGVTCPLGKWI